MDFREYTAMHADADSLQEHLNKSIFEIPLKNAIEFGTLKPHYNEPMHYPNEVELYEPNIPKAKSSQSVATREWTENSGVVKREVEVHLPCGQFNIWRPLYDRKTPISSRLNRFLPHGQHIASQAADEGWDSRISYSSADDEYYMNGIPLPFIKSWDHGMLSKLNVFRKVEHDWLMTYIAPIEVRRPGMESAFVWRFNYVESKRVIKKFHAVLSMSIFAESASAQWYIRPLTQLTFSQIPIRLLAADEAAAFAEIPETDEYSLRDSSAFGDRERILEKYRGQILMYQAKSDQHNGYIAHTVPCLAADLTQYVEDEYGFELGVSFVPASEGENRWQKVQIARQSLRHPVSGRTNSPGAMSRCGLDFRIKLGSTIGLDPVSKELTSALAEEKANSGQENSAPKMDDNTCNFTVRVKDPENAVGSLQPPIRAHESVLAAGSEYFAALLGSSMTESASKKVVLDDLPYGAVRLAVNFLYTNTIPNETSLDFDDWVILLGVASRLSIPRLLQLCQVRIYRYAVEHIDQYKNQSSRNEGTQHYMTKAEFPDIEFVDDLLRIANDTGARELSTALEQMVAYYPVQVCESRIRNSSSMVDFIEMSNPIFGHHHMHPQDRDQGRNLWPPVQMNAANNFHAIGMPGMMAGPVVHPELVAGVFDTVNAHGIHGHHHSDLDNDSGSNDDYYDGDSDDEPTEYVNDTTAHHENTNQGGFLAHFMGNWRVVDNDTANHRPPSPQPGPVPSLQDPSPSTADTAEQRSGQHPAPQ
ncbi:protein modification by small protein conjugation or removal [Coemansia sp. RSA 1813]|nr:protein modification by small protein conjugation or removal [Coemansia sp. RSA 1646]KAJ1770123.1 protein modification by small protein conjugation or removal [Coemansia sp. RSA 1843]KAJ2089838.1 protein modification by small protein conjugation or removal [Coemansia sp. RSA 986]KAJ2214777.1 protein modification by small protein conjugation or removal [Coemansia sp. RSA 487]KAJ2569764.1 protein modification by small protein conjugation or removal [Coemansia sp. RSA 1813]